MKKKKKLANEGWAKKSWNNRHFAKQYSHISLDNDHEYQCYNRKTKEKCDGIPE